jgi:phospho-N-acetylmuramoyl-pentapeptide-transferase
MLMTGKATVEILAAVFLIVAMGGLGFLDDFLKLRNRHSEGLTAAQKMIGQIVVAFIFSVALWKLTGGKVWTPFIDRYINLGILYIPLAILIISATANGVNFTDGIDGLCSGVTFIVAIAFMLLCQVWDMPRLASLAGSLAGGCMGFLLFNLHPARVFMGDTGSLALGGAVASLALLTGTELLLPILGIIYVAEVASVILQVGFFKLTHGKRLFRMSPLHHHFELCGWGESRVDVVFWLATAVAAFAFLWILL